MVSTMKTRVLALIDEQPDGFITPSQFRFVGEYREVFDIIYKLIAKGILQKRDCEGTAYERTHNL